MSAQKFVKKKAKTGEKKLKTEPVEKAVKKIEVKEEPVIPMGRMRISVIGVDAIGGLIAAYLKSKRRQVKAVGTAEQMRTIRSNGLKVAGAKDAVYVELDIKVKMEEKADLVILAVKTKDMRAVIEENRDFLRGPLILTIQNDVGADQIVSLALGKENILSSIAMFGSSYLRPGLINYDFEGDWFIGKAFGANDDKVKEVAEELSPAFKISIAENITGMKWTQLIVKAANCIPALLGKSIQETFVNLDMAFVGVLLLKECLAVVDEIGISLSDLPSFTVNTLRELVAMPAEDAARSFSDIMVKSSVNPQNNFSSKDIALAYLSDMDYINGEIIRRARFGRVGSQLNAKAVNFANRLKKTNTFFSIEEISQAFKSINN